MPVAADTRFRKDGVANGQSRIGLYHCGRLGYAALARGRSHAWRLPPTINSRSVRRISQRGAFRRQGGLQRFRIPHTPAEKIATT
jgi:hypothetical protein